MNCAWSTALEGLSSSHSRRSACVSSSATPACKGRLARCAVTSSQDPRHPPNLTRALQSLFQHSTGNACSQSGNKWRLKPSLMLLISAVTWGRMGGETRQQLMYNAERTLQPVGNLSTPPLPYFSLSSPSSVK